MNRFFISNILVGCLFLFAATAWAQNFQSDLKKTFDHYHQSENYHISVLMDVRMKSDEKASFYQREYTIAKKGTSYFYKMDNMHVLMTEDKMLSIYPLEKKVLCKDIKKSEYQTLLKQFNSFNMDSLIQKYDSLVYKGSVGGIKQYTIYSGNRMIERVDLFLKGSRFDQIIYHYGPLGNGVGKVHIRFSEKSEPMGEENFNLFTYLKKGAKISLSDAYRHYNLIIIDDEM
ncbi:MAG: hypothetical protein ACK4ND_01880 [Cytophagaceae bacterium]